MISEHLIIQYIWNKFLIPLYIGVTITNRVIENLVLSTCPVYFLCMHRVHHLVNTELESPTFKVPLAKPALPKNGACRLFEARSVQDFLCSNLFPYLQYIHQFAMASANENPCKHNKQGNICRHRNLFHSFLLSVFAKFPLFFGLLYTLHSFV